MSANISEKSFSSLYNKQTLVAAVVASTAATITVGLSLPLWVMFIGWIGYSTCSGSVRDSIISAICTCLGFSLAMLAVLVVDTLSGHIGIAAFSIVVFTIATTVVSLRSFEWVGNVVAWFLGLVTYFASLSDASDQSVIAVLLTNLFGLCAGFVANQLQQKLT